MAQRKRELWWPITLCIALALYGCWMIVSDGPSAHAWRLVFVFGLIALLTTIHLLDARARLARWRRLRDDAQKSDKHDDHKP